MKRRKNWEKKLIKQSFYVYQQGRHMLRQSLLRFTLNVSIMYFILHSLFFIQFTNVKFNLIVYIMPVCTAN